MEAQDEDIVAGILSRCSPQTVCTFAQSSKRMLRIAESDRVWGVLFLRQFGPDLWDEHTTGPHPYLRSAIPRFEDGKDLANKTPEDIWSQYANVIAKYPSLSELKREEEEGGGARMKTLFKRYLAMLKIWLGPDRLSLARIPVRVVLAGIDRQARDAAMNLITTCCLVRQSDPAVVELGISLTNSNQKELLGAGEDLTRADSGGGTEVVHATAMWRAYGTWDTRPIVLLNVARLRNWYPQYRQELPYASWCTTRALIFAVDAVALQDNKQHQDVVYRELHGTFGEAADEKYLQVLVLYMRAFDKNALPLDTFRALMKFPLYVEPNDMCPHYAGPVYIAIAALRIGTITDTIPLEDKAAVGLGLGWVSRQQRRPDWDLRSDSRNMTVCVLQDNTQAHI